MENNSNFFCNSSLLLSIDRNTSISEAISECFAFVFAPLILLLLSLVIPIFLSIYSKIFIQPRLAVTKLVVIKLTISSIYLLLAFAQFVYSIITDVQAYNKELFNYSWINFLLSLFLTFSYFQCYYYGIVSSGLVHLCWFLQSLILIPNGILWLKIVNNSDLFLNISRTYGLISYVFYHLISISLSILFCFADRHPSSSENFAVTKPVNPELKSSAISRFIFWYVSPLLDIGSKGRFTFDNIWGLDKRYKADFLTDRFYKALRDHPPTAKKSIIPWIVWPLLKATWIPVSVTFVFALILLPFDLVSPLFIRWIVDSLSKNNPLWFSVLGLIVMFLLRIFQELLSTKQNYYGLEAYLNAKSILVNIVFDKMLKLSPSIRAKYSSGEFINIISTDVDRVYWFWCSLYNYLYNPLYIIMSIGFLIYVLGHNALYGLGIIVSFMPLNLYCAKVEAKYEDAQMEYKDERLKLMSDILSGIKVLKLYAWETPMQKRIAEIRECETKELRKSNYIGMGVIEISWNVSPILATVACFIGYTLIDGNKLTPQIAFVSLVLFHMMRRSATSLPFMISNAIRSFVSMRRISEFLDSVELDEGHIKRGVGEEIVAIENGSFTWDSFDDPSSTKHLQNIDLNIHKGELVGVVGRVGSGKSSLLAAISGEMHRLEGSCKVVSSSIGYVPQQSWIQNKTLKDNVLFHKLYDEDYYNKTIDTCALRDDLKMLSAGDMTEIGERGINLSGGQKARVSLARAVYQKSDLYILDDTLSAVDSHVGNHIFENVIGPNGLLKDTTRIFALNSLAFLRYCDRLVVMQDGKINEIGTYDELLSKPDGAFAEWMREHAKKLIEQRKSRESTIEGEDAEMEDILRELSTPSTPASVIIRRFSSMEAIDGKFSRQVSNMSVKSTITEVSAHQPQMTHNSPPVEGQLIEDEYTEVGKVSWRMYWDYIQAFGAVRMASYIFVLFFMSSATDALSNIWLAKWSSESEQNPNDPKNLIIYGTSSIFTCIAVGAAGFIFAWGTFKASLKFHDSLVHSLLKSPMSFFDTTPLGRILNRISNDIDKVDQEIPANFSYSLLIINAVFVSIVTIIIVIPGLLIIAIPLFVLFIKLARYYTATSVQIRRLFKKSWSLVLSYVQDAYIGADSLRVFNATDRSKNQMRQISDMSIETTHTEVTCNQWIQVRLDILTQIVIFGFILVAIYLGDHKIISMGILALVITNGETFSGNLGNIARQWKKAEMSIVSVERINEYVNNKHEAPWEIESSRPPNNWPASGLITFNNLCLKYREDTDLVLKHLNFVIKGGEKVGIVGRTGAGKSSLTLALFRLIEPSEGTIEIDGIDIRKIGLHDIRRALTIIPQDPVLFCGTLRSNLDPFDQFSDGEVWLAIEQAHLKQFVVNFEEKLDYKINEGGSNLSVGQRQLVCLARALLRKNTRILVLDEATAAVDVETDRLIQDSIRQYFGHCTILTIAHRLNTILDYDKILVMDAGEVREFETPRNLLSDPHSLFSSLAKNAGITVESL